MDLGILSYYIILYLILNKYFDIKTHNNVQMMNILFYYKQYKPYHKNTV